MLIGNAYIKQKKSQSKACVEDPLWAIRKKKYLDTWGYNFFPEKKKITVVAILRVGLGELLISFCVFFYHLDFLTLYVYFLFLSPLRPPPAFFLPFFFPFWNKYIVTHSFFTSFVLFWFKKQHNKWFATKIKKNIFLTPMTKMGVGVGRCQGTNYTLKFLCIVVLLL